MKYNYCFVSTCETVGFSNFLITHDLSCGLIQQLALTVLTVSKYVDKTFYIGFNIYRMFFLKIILVIFVVKG